MFSFYGNTPLLNATFMQSCNFPAHHPPSTSSTHHPSDQSQRSERAPPVPHPANWTIETTLCKRERGFKIDNSRWIKFRLKNPDTSTVWWLHYLGDDFSTSISKSVPSSDCIECAENVRYNFVCLSGVWALDWCLVSIILAVIFQLIIWYRTLQATML